LTENLVVTCSGNFSAPAFLCTVMALGIDNVPFSVDWPYESNVAAVDFLKCQPLEQHDIEKVASQCRARFASLTLSGSPKNPRRRIAARKTRIPARVSAA
jgi:hypothetical protein